MLGTQRMPVKDLAIRIGLKLLGALALAELAIMLLLHLFNAEQRLSSLLVALLDALILSCVASFLIYRWVIAPIRDAESLKQMHQAMELFRSLVDQSSDVLFILDPATGRILDINSMACKALGYSRPELLDRTIMDIDASVPDLPAWQNLAKRVGAAGTTVWEGIEKRKDGTSFPVETSSRHSAFGQSTYIVALARDITEQKRLQQNLQQQKLFAEDLIECSAIATFVLDPQHRILTWNRACEQLTGRRASEMVGTDRPWKAFYDHERPTLADLVINSDPVLLSRHYTSSARSPLNPDALHAEQWFTGLNGRDRYLSFDAAPLRGQSGEIIAVIETIQDLTEHKWAGR